MRSDEALTKFVIEHVITGSEMTYITSQSKGEHDFDLKLSDGSVERVEVTSSIDKTFLETLEAIKKPRAGGARIEPVHCKRTWHILPAKKAKISYIRKHADKWLASLEAQNIDRFCWADSEQFKTDCSSLGLVGGKVISDAMPALIEIGHPQSGGAVGPLSAVEAGVQEAWKEDNRRKLRSEDGSRSHLCVCLTSSALMVMNYFHPPVIPPKLPLETSNLWLIGNSVQNSYYTVWHFQAEGHWERFEVDRVNGHVTTIPSKCLQ